MAYGYNNYYYPSAYQPLVYPTPVPQQQNVPYVPQPQPRQADTGTQLPPISSIAWVDGLTSAKAQNIQYGTSCLLLDSKEPYFYIKTVG